MCDKDASNSTQPIPSAYSVDPSHPLYDDSASKELLSRLPAPLAEGFRAKARPLADCVLVRIAIGFSSPEAIIAELGNPVRQAISAGILAACDEEITRRYRDGILAVELVRGGEEADDYMASSTVQAELKAFEDSVSISIASRSGATIH